MKELYQKFSKGEKVGLDKDLANNSEVIVVRQTPKQMFTTVTSNGSDEWGVMTYRLTSLK